MIFRNLLFSLLLISAAFGKSSIANIQKIELNRLLEDEKNTIGIYDQYVRSVVNVSNIRIARTGLFFNYSEAEIPAGAGTGLVWDKNGHIVTNYHVIKGGDNFLITFYKDKKQYKAKLVGVEPRKDIAILKVINPPKKLVPVKVGNSSLLRVGQKSLAIGNPFGLDHTVTTGNISALGRKMMGVGNVSIHGMIQTDASINPGNSGGPLINSLGEVIGMNTMIYSQSGGSNGIGFAVPINTIKRISEQIINFGEVIRPGLGIALLEDEVKEHFAIKEGVVIKYVNPNGPASKAKLEGIGQDQYGRYHLGDIILAVNGSTVNSFDDIYNALDKFNIGDKVKIKYRRSKKIREVEIELIKI